MKYVYDIEIYPNFFSVIFKNTDTKEIHTFVIYKTRNDLHSLYRFMAKNRNSWFIGYNSMWFDNQILNFLYKMSSVLRNESSAYICNTLYILANDIIEIESSAHKYNLPFKSIDLMKVGNVDNKSLKLVAVNLDWPLIQDLPINPSDYILDEQVDELLKYNLNDVNITEALYYSLKKEIKVRYEISELFEINVMNETDSGMANRLLEKLYSHEANIEIKLLRQMRTERPIIHYENIIFEEIQFRSPQLQKVLSELKTKRFFKKMPFFKKDIIFNGVKYQLGIGGLHSVDKPKRFLADNETKIIDCDITSFYPNIIIKHGLFPAHLGERFLLLYKRLVDERLRSKSAGEISKAEVLKICINSVFGKTLYEHHWLYDPLVGLRTTINGQLFLLLLIEDLSLAGFEVISANTDGVVSIVPKNKEKEYKEVCKKWSEKTKFNLEYVEYLSYVRTTVNDYMAIVQIIPEEDVKQKGLFLQRNKISLMKGIDRPIISKALYEHFIYGTPIENTILNHTNIYDFCIAKKTDKKFINEYHYLENSIHKIDELQQSVRFFISVNGGTLYKVNKKENKYISYCVGKKVTVLNDNRHLQNIKDYNIDYGYYIREAKKILNEIVSLQLTLF